MSWLLKWTWKPETPARVPAGARNLGGEVGQRADVVAEDGRGVGELGAGELHTVAGVARKTNRHRFQLFDGVPIAGKLQIGIGHGHEFLSGQWSVVSGQWSAAGKCWPLTTDHWPLRQAPSRS